MNASPDHKPGRLFALFFDNRYLLVLAMVVLAVAGLSAIKGLPRAEDPIIANRSPIILTSYPGASAEQVEALISKPLEVGLNEIDEIKNINSTSRAGFSLVSVELKDAVGKEDTQLIFSEMRDKIGQVAQQFPSGASEPFLDDQRNAVAYTLIVALGWKDVKKGDDSFGIISRRAEDLADHLRNISGTRLVRLYGKPREEVKITVDPQALSQRGLTVQQVSQALRLSDVKVPAGQLRSGEGNFLLEIEGEIKGLNRIRDIIVQRGPGNQSVRLEEVASVERGLFDPADQIGSSNGRRVVFVAAQMNETQRIDLWDAQANETLEHFRSSLGEAITAEIVFRQNDYTSARLGELVGNLGLGAGVVLLVILVTMGWRRSIIVSLALPLTAAATLFIIFIQGGKLHQMSIFGMIIALGLLIDTAIVVADDIRSSLDKGGTRRDALLQTLRHLAVPLLSSTLTTAFAFLPILLLPGGAGDFVGSIGGSVIIAVSTSFVISMTIIAALGAIFAQKPEKTKNSKTPKWLREGVEARWFAKPMAGLIGFAIKRPLVGIGISLIIPIVGIALAPTLGSQFFPRTDRDMFTVEVTLPSTASIEETVKLTQKIEGRLREYESVEQVHWLAGATFPPVYYNIVENRDNSPEYAMGVLKVRNFEATARLVPELQKNLSAEFPEARILVRKFAQGPPAFADVEMRISGPGISELQRLGDEVQLELANQAKVLATEATLTRGEPKFTFKTDEAAASAAGLVPAAIARQLQEMLEGLPGGSLIEGVEELPIRVRIAAEDRDTLEEILDLRLLGAQGQRVPLRAIGEFHLEPQTSKITRRNNQRVNTVQGFVSPDGLPINITNETKEALENTGFLSLPTGYQFTLGGEAENQADAVGNLMLYLPVIVTLSIAVLVLSFRSLSIAFILLSVAPLAVGYGLLATWIMQFPVSFNTILGCIGLIGLAFNDNIVVLAAIHTDEKARQGDPDAMKKAVTKSGRHLISTTLTTIGSFLPLLILVGGQFWPPLAIVLAGGVAGATFLAAIYSPALYRLMAQFRLAATKRQTK